MKGGIFLLSREDFIRISLETNLFFQRIMKEHLFFIETNLHPVEADNIKEANLLKKSFEELLNETVMLANGAINKKAIDSNEFVTPYTLKAEEINSKLTGASLDTDITKDELKLKSDPNFNYNQWLESCIININQRSINLLGEVLSFKKKILNLTLECKISISLYPELLKHIIEEGELYLEILRALQNKTLPKKTLCEELNFWNHIMGEHGEFIDGMLDPTERELKKTAKQYAEIFERLVKECIKVSQRQIFNRSFNATKSIQGFKQDSTEGILACKIKSIIPPLLADHVLREANHYLRLLKMMCR